MARIGMIGGMSWESTAEYYRLANRLYAERLGGLHSAPILLASVDFAEVEAMQSEGRWDDAGELLAGLASELETAGVGVIVLCTNTMHKVADRIEKAVVVPLLHIADATAAAVKAAGVTTLGLLGTAYTMEQAFLRDRLESHGLQVVVPDEDDRATVHSVIYDELCLGVMRDESRQGFREVIGRLATAGAEGVALACTEIELLVSRADSPVPLFPTTRIHVEAAVDHVLRGA